MISFVNIELYKLYKSKKNLYIFFSLLFLVVITGIISYFLKETRYSYISYMYYLLSINSLTFPIINAVLFCSEIIDEFSNGSIKGLISSSFDREKIYLGKFFASILLFFPMLILMIFLYLIVLFICFKVNNYEVFLIYSPVETITRFLLIFSTQIVYLICFSSFITLLSWIINKKSLVILISLVLIVSVALIPTLPNNISDYIFLTNSKTYGYIFADNFDIFKILSNLFINICTTCIFLIIGIITMKNKEFY